ncbi:amidohydrolase family protein [Psychromonas sp. MME2]|uniref:amidohydrolase family protein n=1 Tax=Psychromonas sp. MME2 TaxID=3231033 RepID=UPI00339CE95F
MTKYIYNCHTHIFTHKHIPDRYFYLGFVKAARIKWLRKIIQTVMKTIIPFSENDLAHRYAGFVETAYRDTQQENADALISCYKQYPNMKFIVLPMDMELMERGKVKENIDKQHKELVELCNDEKYRDKLIPFAHINPRQPNALSKLKELVEQNGIKGVKIYPPLGYRPDHPVLINDIYPYLMQMNLPLMAHCAKGDVYQGYRRFAKNRKAALEYMNPIHYIEILKKFKKLRICLAHFGSDSDWQSISTSSINPKNPDHWHSIIKQMINSNQYPNLFTDISYSCSAKSNNLNVLANMMEEEAPINSRILFGTDFYIATSNKIKENDITTNIQDKLNPKHFDLITRKNPETYLYGK